MQLFVYGSLLRGMSLASYMEGTKFLGPAYVMADLFYLGFYPGIITGNQVVYGELYEVTEQQIPAIDEVEDYIELDNERSAYLRRPIDAFRFSDGKKVKAQAYFYNRCPKNKPRIESGDYRVFMNAKEGNDLWVIGYASILSSESILSNLGTIPERKVGFVDGFERVYNVRTGVNGNAHANLEYKGGRQRCNAVAWKVTKQQLERLDESERVPHRYSRVSVPFTTLDGELIHAQAYFGNTNRLGKNLHPDPLHYSLVKAGMVEYGFK